MDYLDKDVIPDFLGGESMVSLAVVLGPRKERGRSLGTQTSGARKLMDSTLEDPAPLPLAKGRCWL